MKIRADAIAAIIAFAAIVSSGFGWLLTIENRLTNKVNKAALTIEIKDTKELLRGEISDLKAELNTDIRILRDRVYQQQFQPQPQPQTQYHIVP